MFLAKNHCKVTSDYPTKSAIREPDWHVLAALWHPVAFVSEVGKHPVRQTLLDIDLVLYRTANGITVARDRCPHRGARLSNGTIENDLLICPMHGLHYDAEGACTLVPSIPEPKPPVPETLCLKKYLSKERYGLIWVCLKDEASRALPHWPELEVADRKVINLPPDEWNSSAGRHVENFNDIAHFPWVHIQSFGGEKTDAFPLYSVDKTDTGLRFEVCYTEGGNRFPDDVEADNRDVRYIYEHTFPFSTLLHVKPVDSEFAHYFADTVCPVSSEQIRIFQLYTDTTGNPDTKAWSEEAIIINAEDKPLVEGQTPRALPLDFAHDISIPADRFSIEYRRALVNELGLGFPEPEPETKLEPD